MWGSFIDDEGNERLARFDLRGTVNRVLEGPFQQEVPQFSMVFSRPRNSLFVADLSGDIVELDRDGGVIRRLPFAIPGGGYETQGLGWNSHDPVDMPLYIFVANVDADIRRLVRMDPNSGRWEVCGDSLSGDDTFLTYYGFATVTHRADTITSVAMMEELNSGDYFLRFYEIGPNVSFLSGNVRGRIGSVAAGETGSAVLPFDVTGWDEGIHRFGLRVMHNALGGERLVPVRLVIDDEAEVGAQDRVLPSSFELTAVYPNPFNAATRITIALETARRVHLELFDINGRRVAELYAGDLPAGYHTLSWQADDIPSGVYFVRLRSAGQIRSAKAAIVR